MIPEHAAPPIGTAVVEALTPLMLNQFHAYLLVQTWFCESFYLQRIGPNAEAFEFPTAHAGALKRNCRHFRLTVQLAFQDGLFERRGPQELVPDGPVWIGDPQPELFTFQMRSLAGPPYRDLGRRIQGEAG